MQYNAVEFWIRKTYKIDLKCAVYLLFNIEIYEQI
jgi:hypothetical protein